MKRRDFLKLAGTGILYEALGFVSLSAQVPSKKPNIILCMADDQGWGDMGYNGHPVLKTPNFDAMAAEALCFDRFYAAAPVCSPTRGSVLTGRHPNRFGCFTWGRTLRPQEVTLAEVLRGEGYSTGHFGKWHLGSVFRNSPVNPGASGFDEWLSTPNHFDNDPILSRQGAAVSFKGDGSMVVVEAALDFIRRQAADRKPFLAVVWFGSPHAPHQALEHDRALYAEKREKLQHFYGEITAMDRAFGKLRTELRTIGIHENTILWYCSDNGGLPNIGTTGGRAAKSKIYEGGLRVPAIFEWPARIAAPGTTNVPCNTCDIYPTLLDICGVKPVHKMPLDGISLVSLLDGAMKTRPSPMGFWHYPAEGLVLDSRQIMSELLELQKAGKEIEDPARLDLSAGQIARQYPNDAFPGHSAWLDWPWKLHRIQNDDTLTWELYNLESDPLEAKSLLPEQSERSNRMQSQLEDWLKSVVGSLNGADYKYSMDKQ